MFCVNKCFYLTKVANYQRKLTLVNIYKDKKVVKLTTSDMDIKKSLDFRECKICKNQKVRVQEGVFPQGKYPKYCDENGRLWNGLVCPECNVDLTREKMRKSRANRKELRQWLE